MAITQDNSATSSVDADFTLTFALTVAAGATKLIVQIVHISIPDAVVREVTYAGVNLTQAVSAENTFVASVIDIWYLDNPDAGANDVVITTNGSGNTRATATSLFGTVSGAPEDTDTLTDSGPATEVNLSFTSTLGAWIFDAVSSSASAMTPNDDQTLNLDYDFQTVGGSYKTDSNQTSTSTRWEVLLSDVFGICGVSIAAAPTGRLNMLGDGLQWSLHIV